MNTDTSFQPSSDSVNIVNTGKCIFTLSNNRLGHPHSLVVKHVLQSSNISVPSNNIEFCSVRQYGKSHRQHSPLSNSLYNFPCELVFSDLWVLPCHFFLHRAFILRARLFVLFEREKSIFSVIYLCFSKKVKAENNKFFYFF